jgi:hypothetical protein
VVRFHLAPPVPVPTPSGSGAVVAEVLDSPGVRAFRRGLLVAFVAVVAAGIVRLRGKGGVPPTSGGWRELEAPDFR